MRLLGHVYTRDHNAFNRTRRAVININRDSMARFGFSPPTRVFEAAGIGQAALRRVLAQHTYSHRALAPARHERGHREYGARRVRPLYCSVDPADYHPAAGSPRARDTRSTCARRSRASRPSSPRCAPRS